MRLHIRLSKIIGNMHIITLSNIHTPRRNITRGIDSMRTSHLMLLLKIGVHPRISIQGFITIPRMLMLPRNFQQRRIERLQKMWSSVRLHYIP